jgi:hydroxymethylbilane synthase
VTGCRAVSERTVIRLATRGSPLALWQAQRVAGLLERSGVPSTLVVVDTDGDRRLDVPLDRLGGQGIFVKEVQAAVVRGDADAAVHSAKDLPASAELDVPGLALAAFPERADPRDVLVGDHLDTLPTGLDGGHRVGAPPSPAGQPPTRPHLHRPPRQPGHPAGRGGSGERGRRGGGQCRARPAGMVPPAGGADRGPRSWDDAPPGWAGGAGRGVPEGDEAVGRALAAIDDPATRRLVTAERAYLAELGGGCTLPVGAYARWAGVTPAGDPPHDGLIELTGMLASADGVVVLRHAEVGDRPADLGRSVARHLLDGAGGRRLGEWESATSGELAGSRAAVDR